MNLLSYQPAYMRVSCTPTPTLNLTGEENHPEKRNYNNHDAALNNEHLLAGINEEGETSS
jgi:hypothetical protein